MKKMIIALAAVALVGAAEAATTNWKFNLGTTGIIKDGYIKANNPSATPAAMNAATVYILTSSAVEGGISQADLVSAFQSGTLNINAYKLASGSTSSQGKIPSASSIEFSSDVFDAGSYYDFYAVVLADDYIYVSADKNVAAYDPSKTQTITPTVSTTTTYVGTGAYSAPGWYGVGAVPEPTSGLLMLLGMAGLALRRRRA